ncbi:MAG TPA: CDP-alcohol phosphatidyltransferase family protein [Hellea balneolensis]|uniref:CDP-alcohol phosphatidyltransferase family protein n=1 Tax=Hellea balneolensis TaxID=287478 RepID=A0A7V5NWY9_9PROT|nr:CDP-alcohol phosphatidyltransferase family protein [Hellea balneolensis]
MNGDSRAAQGAQYGRPLIIEDISNRVFVHPLSSLVVRLALALRLSANTVSVLGLCAGLLSAWFYYHQSRPGYVVAGFALMVLWHILDGADGRIARATGTASAFGRIIDGICDHLVFGAVYIAFILYALGQGASPWIWALGVVSALSHALQAAGYEERRQIFQRRMRGLSRKEVSENLLHVGEKKSVLATIYDRFQTLTSPKPSKLDVNIEACRQQGMDAEKISSLVARTSPIVRAWGLLNANNRTIMLAVCAGLGHPLWYFIYESVILNIVFAGLLVWERRFEHKLAQQSLAEAAAL